MALEGKAALAMWWDMSADRLDEFQDWHSHEHFRERLAIPGFHRGTRWRNADGGEGIFQMYELEDHAVLSSPAYLARLNSPTPWSLKMMPLHRNMVRSQCRVLASVGGGVAGSALTVRLSPEPGQDEELLVMLKQLVVELPAQAGCVGAHVLRHEAPEIAQTTEQRVRGGDGFADWVIVVVGYDPAKLRDLAKLELSHKALHRAGAAEVPRWDFFSLCHSAVPADFASP
jgi:hypothetical protein